MNKYRDKSDFEINKAVAEYYLTCAYRFNSADEVVELINIDLSCEFGGKINRVDNQVIGTFDPCNNPADAMPIIIDNGISLIFDTGCKAWVAGIAYWVDGCEWQISHEVERMNQYRAAMELFLMMKDAENEKV